MDDKGVLGRSRKLRTKYFIASFAHVHLTCMKVSLVSILALVTDVLTMMSCTSFVLSGIIANTLCCIKNITGEAHVLPCCWFSSLVTRSH